MTIERAVEILNKHEHHDHSGWHYDKLYVRGETWCEAYEPFVAIAIAEKYEREAP
jgi:hypothetical protein